MAALNTSLNELLRDDVTLAVLEADGLSAAQFRATLQAAAERLRRDDRPAARSEPRRFTSARDLVGFSLSCCGA